VLEKNRPVDGWHAVHHLETALYLRNQLLRDSDWASMASSLELRVPFVDAWLQGVGLRSSHEPARCRGKATLVRSLAPSYLTGPQPAEDGLDAICRVARRR
jgi:hypothetical protein